MFLLSARVGAGSSQKGVLRYHSGATRVWRTSPVKDANPPIRAVHRAAGTQAILSGQKKAPLSQGEDRDTQEHGRTQILTALLQEWLRRVRNRLATRRSSQGPKAVDPPHPPVRAPLQARRPATTDTVGLPPSQCLPAISAARLAGDHDMSRLATRWSFQRSMTAFASARGQRRQPAASRLEA